jgi:hypothetical protein
VNQITGWLDGSMVYGSSTAVADSLRTHVKGALKASTGNLLPTDSAGNFLAGDDRVNENPDLTSLQTLFLREHNRIAAQIAKQNPNWTDEQIYQAARAQVIAEIEVITYQEWLPAVLGPNALPVYRGYNPQVNAGISNEFATAGFRVGHSMVGNDIEFLNDQGLPVRDEVDLADAFFNPSVVAGAGIDPILKYLSSDPMQEVDTKVVDGLRNFLFGAPGSGGMDLAAINIQRGRDQGLASYNDTRAAYGLPKVTSFLQITGDPTTAAQMQAVYGSVDKVDLWVGALAEKHVPGGSVGPTLRAIIADQFIRTRDGDRFWYQKTFSGVQLQQIESTTLAGVIKANTTLRNIQDNVFFFKADVSGTIFSDANHNGRMDPGDRPQAGRMVLLINHDDGSLVAQTTTDSQGRYHFGVADGLRTGQYEIRVVPPAGQAPTNPPPQVLISRGDLSIGGLNIGLAPAPGGHSLVMLGTDLDDLHPTRGR